MSVQIPVSCGPFPAQVVSAVRESVAATFSSICGTAPELRDEVTEGPADCVIGTIGFVSDQPWALALVLPEAPALALAQKFAGFEIPFDSPDMGDVVGELANVLAGDVRARLESKKIKTQMSLPTVARGKGLELLEGQAQPRVHLVFRLPEGTFLCHLLGGKPGGLFGRLPGT